jgi:hypothetical protein
VWTRVCKSRSAPGTFLRTSRIPLFEGSHAGESCPPTGNVAVCSSISSRRRLRRRSPALGGLTTALLFVASCGDSGPAGPALLGDLECSIPESEIFSGGVLPGGIPALENPEFVSPDDPAADYLRNTDGFPDPRVVGIVAEGEAFAIPHNILWWHEIVNLDLPSGVQVSVTYCPLTGSSLVFDRSPVDGAEFLVSGLIFQNNLMMFDRRADRSLWPQMMRGARCGREDGTTLPMYPAMGTTWSAWKSLHPSTSVVGSSTGIPRDYTVYPYGGYKANAELLFSQSEIDERRPMKEWVLGIPSTSGSGGIAFPFGALRSAESGAVAVVHSSSPRGQVVVLWDERAAGAMAFYPAVEGSPVTLRADENRIVDEETASEWRLDGLAVSGPMAGATLEPVAEAYPAFWFAWAAFHPATDIWEP